MAVEVTPAGTGDALGLWGRADLRDPAGWKLKKVGQRLRDKLVNAEHVKIK